MHTYLLYAFVLRTNLSVTNVLLMKNISLCRQKWSYGQVFSTKLFRKFLYNQGSSVCLFLSLFLSLFLCFKAETQKACWYSSIENCFGAPHHGGDTFHCPKINSALEYPYNTLLTSTVLYTLMQRHMMAKELEGWFPLQEKSLWAWTRNSTTNLLIIIFAYNQINKGMVQWLQSSLTILWSETRLKKKKKQTHQEVDIFFSMPQITIIWVFFHSWLRWWLAFFFDGMALYNWAVVTNWKTLTVSWNHHDSGVRVFFQSFFQG